MKEKQQITHIKNIPAYQGSKDLFTGEVWIQPIFLDNQEASFSAVYVRFAPGARTHWHTHPAGQHLIVTEGIGLTCEENGQVHEFHVGETIWCPKDVKHWHGATPHSSMTHIALTGIKDNKMVEWLDKVTNEEYHGPVCNREDS